MIKRILGGIRRQIFVVTRERRRAADNVRAEFTQAHADLAGDFLLRRFHKCVERLTHRRKPQAVIHELRVLLRDPLLVMQKFAIQHEALKVGMREHEDRRRRSFVRLARLDADEAVFDHVHAADAVLRAHIIKLRDELEGPEFLAVKADRDAFVEFDRDNTVLEIPLFGAARPLERILRRFRIRVLEDAGLDRYAPHIFVDGIGALLRDVDGYPVFERVINLFVARLKFPFAQRRQDLKRAVKRLDRHFKTHLVVALAGTAVADRGRLLGVRDSDLLSRDAGP